METAFGDVAVEEEPTRVVALGWSDAETALALGVEPVGASDWLAVGGDDGLGDWVEQGYEEPPVLIEALEPSFEALATDDFFVPVSEEQLSLLGAELTVVFPIVVEASEFTGDPLWQALPAVQEGRAVVLEDLTVLDAFSSASAPGLLHAIDATVPQFAEALDQPS